MTDTRVLRYEIPVDDAWHPLLIGDAPILHVAARCPEVVELWVTEPRFVYARWFRVFGTGHPGVHGTHAGSTITANGALVWHLFEEDETVIAVRGEARA